MYEVNIDFDEASVLWRINKKRHEDGTFSYVCGCKRRYHPGHCRRLPENVQKAKKLAGTPGTLEYTAGLKKRPPCTHWEHCIAHRDCPR